MTKCNVHPSLEIIKIKSKEWVDGRLEVKYVMACPLCIMQQDKGKPRKPRRPDDDHAMYPQEFDKSGWVKESLVRDDTLEWVHYMRRLRLHVKHEPEDEHKDGQVIEFEDIVKRDRVVYDIDTSSSTTTGRYWDEESGTIWVVVYLNDNRWGAILQEGE